MIVGDGMADEPLEELGGKTPLEVAFTPNMDFFASAGRVGMTRTVPKGMPPGSDVANLSLLGYSPEKYYTGRAPLEAASMGISMAEDDMAFRCNLVRLEETPEELRMADYSAGSISTEKARECIDQLNNELGHLVAWGGLASEDERTGRDIGLRVALQTQVLGENVQYVEVLSLVFVDALGLDIEKGCRVHPDAGALLDQASQVALGGALDLAPLVLELVVLGPRFELTQLVEVAQPDLADPVGE